MNPLKLLLIILSFLAVACCLIAILTGIQSFSLAGSAFLLIAVLGYLVASQRKKK